MNKDKYDLGFDFDIKDTLQDSEWVKVGNKFIKHVYFCPSGSKKIHQITVIFPDAKTK